MDESAAAGPGSAWLVLYVSPDSHASLKARTNLAAILERYGSDKVRFEVCDVSRDPLRAEEDRILYTPTLVLKSGSPAWIVGGLSDHGAVAHLLRLVGIEETS
jgi:KaiB-like protein